MAPGSDGRTYVCAYCEGKQQVAIDSAQIAEGLKVDLSNVDAFIHRLAHGLHGHMGTRTKLILEAGVVSHFEINLDPDLFVAKRGPTGVVAQHKKLVRGIALKTVAHPLDRWVDLLTRALAGHANENARVAQVVSQLKGG